MGSSAALPLRSRRARESDLTFLANRFALSYNDPTDGLGYPRFEDVTELRAELQLYGQALADAFVVISAGERHAGVVGVLGEPGDDVGYLAGPLTDPPGQPIAVRFALREGISLGRDRRHERLIASVQDENVRLTAALKGSGWIRRSSSLEMECDLTTAQPPVPPPGVEVARVTGAESGDAFLEAARLLGEEERWEGPTAEHLAELLDEDYRCDVVVVGGAVVGAAVWIKLPGTSFGRLDYLAVADAARRQRAGSALVSTVLRSLRDEGTETVYLSVDPANAPARALYRQHTFRETIASTTYRYSLR